MQGKGPVKYPGQGQVSFLLLFFDSASCTYVDNSEARRYRCVTRYNPQVHQSKTHSPAVLVSFQIPPPVVQLQGILHRQRCRCTAIDFVSIPEATVT